MTDIPEGVKLDYQRARDLLTEVVAERGRDYVYYNPKTGGDVNNGGCDYWHEDEPGCLIGNALHRLGVPGGWLSTQEGNNADDVLGRLATNLGWQIEGSAYWLFHRAQKLQDKHEEWGFALDEAVEYATQRTKEEK